MIGLHCNDSDWPSRNKVKYYRGKMVSFDNSTQSELFYNRSDWNVKCDSWLMGSLNIEKYNNLCGPINKK